MLKWKSLLCGLQVLILAVSQLSTYNYGLKLKLDRAALALTSVSDAIFAPVDAEALRVSDAEKRRCRAWFDEHIRTDKAPAYDFSVGGLSLQRCVRDWEISVGAEGEADDRGGKTSLISLRHKRSALCARVEATIYEDKAACEWTVYIRNGGEKLSPVVSRFYAADCTLELGQTDVYYSKGSVPDADDFALQQSAVPLTPLIFNATCGRTETALPFFNLCGKNGGAVLALGWTGQWYASLRQTLCGVRVRAKQQFFSAALEPGEEVRSPLASLTFYDGGSAIKGFNAFRQMLLSCVYPASAKPFRSYMFANEFCTETTDELIEKVNAAETDADVYWMDAGWYTYRDNWYDGVGNWTPDANRFANGLRPLADVIAARGKRFLLWYEPERVREGTVLYEEGKKHDGWILQRRDDLLWNLSDDEACAFLTDYISTSLKENGVGVYRQDFNFNPLAYWHKADKDYRACRWGITENHYITNLYRFLDTLVSRVPGLVIDNCASGGKRLDLEMCRRSVPLWRSDYNCVPADSGRQADVLEATQAMTYGLAFWLPCSGTAQFTESRYASRSALLTHPMTMAPYRETDPAEPLVRSHLRENYFPLTVGGAERDRALAMQFGTEQSGAAVVYVRQNAPASVTLRLNGLSLQKTYTLTDPDDPAFSVRETGKTLMETGVTLTAGAQPCALVLCYETGDVS